MVCAAARDLLVAPLAGAWIETLRKCKVILFRRVAPLAGAWIETVLMLKKSMFSSVAPLAGAWIETQARP